MLAMMLAKHTVLPSHKFYKLILFCRHYTSYIAMLRLYVLIGPPPSHMALPHVFHIFVIPPNNSEIWKSA